MIRINKSSIDTSKSSLCYFVGWDLSAGLTNIRSKINQFAFHLSNPLTVFLRNFFLKRLVKNKKFLNSYLGKIYKS